MTIMGHNRIVEGFMGDWAGKVCRDELIRISVHVSLNFSLTHSAVPVVPNGNLT